MGRKNNKKSVRISVTLDEAEYSELTRLAADLDLSASWMIRRAVSEFVVRHNAEAGSGLPVDPLAPKHAAKTRGKA